MGSKKKDIEETAAEHAAEAVSEAPAEAEPEVHASAVAIGGELPKQEPTLTLEEFAGGLKRHSAAFIAHVRVTGGSRRRTLAAWREALATHNARVVR